MTKLYLVPPLKTIEEELEEIQLPLFDLFMNEDGTWFHEAVKKLEDDTDDK